MSNDAYIKAVCRTYRQAEDLVEGRLQPGDSPYRRLVEGLITLKCPYEKGVRSVKADYGVAVGPDQRLYLDTGRDSSCYTPISHLGPFFSDSAHHADQVARGSSTIIGKYSL